MAGRRLIQRNTILSTFVRHPNAANLLMVLLIIFGLFGLARINTTFFPSVNRPFINVTYVWSGASAEDVESNVLAVVEPAIRFLDGIDLIRSTAQEGAGAIQLRFVEGTDMQRALADTETALNGITTLPEDTEDPVYNESRFFDNVATLSLSGDVPESQLRYWALLVRDELIDAGIDKVVLTGLRKPEVEIEISERQSAQFGVTTSSVAETIRRNSRDLPSGNLDGVVEKQVRALAAGDSLEAIRDIELQSNANGQKLRIDDVANVSRIFNDSGVEGRIGNLQAIEIDVQRSETADTLETAAIFAEYLEELKQKIPPEITLQTYDIRAEALSDRIKLLVENGLGGLLLVIIILFIFLDFRIAFWVAAGIPVALLATLGVMFLMGQTINMISLFGLIMMLGIIVDDAIVVGENTATRFEMGDSALDAAENGVTTMFSPVLAAMTTTIAAFAPIAVITGTIGQIMGVLPYVVFAVIVASLIECFLILPGHLGHALKESENKGWSFKRQIIVALLTGILLAILWQRTDAATVMGNAIGSVNLAKLEAIPPQAMMIAIAAIAVIFAALVEFILTIRTRMALKNPESAQKGNPLRRGFNRAFDGFRNGPFQKLVGLSYDGRYVTVGLAIAMAIIIGVTPLRAQLVKFVFFQSPEAETIRGSLVMEAGTPRDVLLKALDQYDETLREAEATIVEGESVIRAVFTTVGSAGRSSGDNLASMRIQLLPSEQRDISTGDLVTAWRARLPVIPGVERFSISEARGGPPGKDVDVTLFGDSAAQLKAAAEDVAELLEIIPSVRGITDDLPYGKPELIMRLTPRGSALGFTIDDVGRQVRNAFEGSVAYRFVEFGEEVTVRVRLASDREGSAVLRNLFILNQQRQRVPLSEVVRFDEAQSFGRIERENGRTTLAVTADLDTDITTTDDAIALLEQSGRLAEISAKHGVSYEFGGRAEEQRAAFQDLALGTLIALSVIYIILAWVFGSYAQPIAVMMIIPFGFVGAVLGHWLLGFQLTILSLIGLLGLSGILVNDSIILVSRYNERLKEGQDTRLAAIGASRDRFRAVLLTSLTTIGGLLPLLFETSRQAQFLLPMAITIVFGLAISTVMILFFIPALIGIGADIRAVVRWIFGNRNKGRLIEA